MKKGMIIGLAQAVILLSSSLSQAQQPLATDVMNRASQYYLGDKDQILMSVNVWGYVRQPGQYVVPRNTDLISLISFAGGPVEGANLSKVNIIRGGALMTMAGDNGDGEMVAASTKTAEASGVPIIVVDVKSHMESGHIERIPILQAGDTVVLHQSFGNKVERFLGINSIVSIIAAAASVALIVERL